MSGAGNESPLSGDDQDYSCPKYQAKLYQTLFNKDNTLFITPKEKKTTAPPVEMNDSDCSSESSASFYWQHGVYRKKPEQASSSASSPPAAPPAAPPATPSTPPPVRPSTPVPAQGGGVFMPTGRTSGRSNAEGAVAGYGDVARMHPPAPARLPAPQPAPQLSQQLKNAPSEQEALGAKTIAAAAETGRLSELLRQSDAACLDMVQQMAKNTTSSVVSSLVSPLLQYAAPELSEPSKPMQAVGIDDKVSLSGGF